MPGELLPEGSGSVSMTVITRVLILITALYIIMSDLGPRSPAVFVCISELLISLAEKCLFPDPKKMITAYGLRA